MVLRPYTWHSASLAKLLAEVSFGSPCLIVNRLLQIGPVLQDRLAGIFSVKGAEVCAHIPVEVGIQVGFKRV